jgi:hypothetical protein
MVRSGIPRVCFYFCSTERNSGLFSLPLKSSEGNSESLFLIWLHGTEFRVVFSSAEGFGREFRELASIFVQWNGIPSCFLFSGRVRNGIPKFLFRGTAGIPAEITICSVYSVCRGIIFLSEIPNPTSDMCSFAGKRNASTVSVLWQPFLSIIDVPVLCTLHCVQQPVMLLKVSVLQQPVLPLGEDTALMKSIWIIL